MQPTRVCAEVASERVSPAAGIVAEGALEGLLPGVQLDVTQQVALLGEGGTALVAVAHTCMRARLFQLYLTLCDPMDKINKSFR